MFFHNNHLRLVLACIVLAGSESFCLAGWMGFRNETPNTLIVQEVFGNGPQTRLGRPQKVFANETIRDTPPANLSTRQFQIIDPTKPDKPLYSGTFACPVKNDNLLFVIKSDGKGGVTIDTTKLPAAGVRNPGGKKDPVPTTPPEMPPAPKKDPPKKKS